MLIRDGYKDDGMIQVSLSNLSSRLYDNLEYVPADYIDEYRMLSNV